MYLILLQTALRHGFVPLLLERDDDQGNKNVDEEKREDHKVDHIKDGHLHTVAWTWPLVFKSGIYRVFQHPKNTKSTVGNKQKHCKITALVDVSEICLLFFSNVVTTAQKVELLIKGAQSE